MTGVERPEGAASAAAPPEEGTGDDRSHDVIVPAEAPPAAPAEPPAPPGAPPAPPAEPPAPPEAVDPFTEGDGTAPSRRVARSSVALLTAWMFLSTALCYLIATQLPGKPVPLAASAVILAGLGALLAVAATAERRAADQRLRTEARRASNMLRSIESVTDPGLAFLDMDELLATVLSRTKESLEGDLVCVLLADDTEAALRVRASQGAPGIAPVGSRVRMGEGVLGTAAQLGRPIVVSDAGDDMDALPESHKGIASLMAAPLIVHGRTLGIVEVGSVSRRTFHAFDLRLLQVVADRLAALVERARLDDVARRNRYGADHANMHLRVLARGSTVLGKAFESYDAALAELADVVVPEFADWFGVHVMEDSGRVRRVVGIAGNKPDGGPMFKRAGHPHPKGDELVRAAVRERRSQFLVPTTRFDAGDLGAVIHTPDTLGEWPDVTSLLVIPVELRGAVPATLSFATAPGRRGYRPSDLETGRELADRVSVTIDRVHSWRASQRAGEMAFRYAERLRRLVDASLVVNARLSEDEVLQLLVEHTQLALGADVAVVSALPTAGDGRLAEKVWPAGSHPDKGGTGVDLRSLVRTATQLVTRSGEVVRRPDEWVGSESSHAAVPGAATPSPPPGPLTAAAAAAAAAALRVPGWVAAPITDANGDVRRVVVAVGSLGTGFSFEDESVLTLLAQMTSVALRNAGLYAEVVENEQRLQTLVDSSPLAIAELGADGGAQWWNRAAVELFDWTDESVPRRVPVRAGSELVLAGLLESAFAGKPLIGVALPVTGAAGEPLELSVSVSPLGAPGAVAGLLVVAEDVTERHRMLEQFHQAERMNAMSRMAGAVAHDFNNLLTVILGCSDVLMRQLGGDVELAPDVAAIQRAGSRAAALTTQLVRIGGQQLPVQPEVILVDEVVAGMHPMLAGVLGEHVRLEVVAGAGEAAVLVDRSELERSVLNLAINARDAMPEGGTFTIETKRADDPAGPGEEPGARPGAEPGTGLVTLVFADTGVGMDEDTATHCFEPFFTTKGRAKGTGLGLAGVHAMATRAGGEVKVDTAPGAGARFTLTFPAAAAAGDARTATRDPRPGAVAEAVAPGVGGATLLVVDDEAEVLRLEVRELQASGYEVLGAANASAALQLLHAHGGAVDLLLTDVVMPGMNGIELASAVRWRYPDVAVLFVSGHLDEEATVNGPLPSDATLLTKPFGPDELTRTVREVLRTARAASARGRLGAADLDAAPAPVDA